MSSEKKRYPVNGTFELTGRCNLSCKMCLVRVDRARMEELGQRERTAKEWIHMAEQVRDAGTIGLLLTGGEAMLRPDFCEIYEAIAQMGFLLTLYTNATMVTDKVMEVLKKYPPHKIGVTMYGASNETYEKMCGCADGYDRFAEGVRRLSTLPSLFDTRTTIIKDNWQDLEAMREFTRREFGEDKVLTVSRFVTDAVRGGICHPKECRLSPEENVELVHEGLVKFYRQVQSGEVKLPEPKDKLKMKRYALPDEGRYLFENCGAGLNQYSISWNGRMYACELLTQGYTEPFENGFIKAWEELPEQYPKSKPVEKCTTCDFAAFCGSCPAVRMSETGDWFGTSEYACGEAEYLYKILSELKVL
ncbi:MAG: radical SAM protein [Lachnospiraceae bacterium]|nr:radical SAM protein [Lachnospiraceae bacterium]